MSLWKKGEEVYTWGSYCFNGVLPCGCDGDNEYRFSFQRTHLVKRHGTIAECAECGATWNDDEAEGFRLA